jgi:hypothetical protein
MLASGDTKDIYLINIKMSKVDFCIKKAKSKANTVCFETLNIESNMWLQGNRFMFRDTIILTCEAYARSRIAPINLPHAGEKRGQENQSNSRPSLWFRRHLGCGNA